MTIFARHIHTLVLDIHLFKKLKLIVSENEVEDLKEGHILCSTTSKPKMWQLSQKDFFSTYKITATSPDGWWVCEPINLNDSNNIQKD